MEDDSRIASIGAKKQQNECVIAAIEPGSPLEKLICRNTL